MEQTAWFSVARPLVVLHAAASIVLVGASTHHLLVVWRHLRWGRGARSNHVHAATVGVTYVITMALGALAYPTFRYHVRALFLDRYEPWASNLFDIKENLATIGLPLALAAWWLGRAFARDDREIRAGYAILVTLVTAIVWTDVVAGLTVTLVRGVG